MTKEAVGAYLRELEGIDGAGATEFTYRTPLDKLLCALAPAGVKVVQEPRREAGTGAPDFRIEHASGAVVGYVECKKPGENLQALSHGKQVEKYRNLSPNILLTDYWNFHLLHENFDIPLASLQGGARQDRRAAEELLRRFLGGRPQEIGDARALAGALAERCRVLRAPLAQNLKADEGRLSGIFKVFRDTIYRDIDELAFADALAQTLVYGLLTARLNMVNGDSLGLHNVKRHIPGNFELLREIANFLDELEEPPYAGIKYLVDDVLAVVNHMDAAAVTESMSYRGGKTAGDDPYLYFYEHFLAVYDARLREERGVYYTPPPVVRFIARAADDLLKRDLGLATGLAHERVTALDFAAGTGTFMLEMFRLVFAGKDLAGRDLAARGHLLRNFFGFEFLLAPFAIAHLKLSQFLKDNGINLNNDERVNVFLTNTLEPAADMPELSFMPALARETRRAQEIKQSEILVIIGNPPYSGQPQNKGKWIHELVRDYYRVDGGPLGERNPKWLQDDYVKFIRLAQHKMDEAQEGVVAMITNHAFLDNPTFRGMRQSLMRSFDALYFLDLHGNSNQGEQAPDGGRDENVFAIRQGVAVSLLVKRKGLEKGVFHADLFGGRADKYKWCEGADISSVRWKRLKPASPFYLFVPRDERGWKEYRQFPSVKDMFVANSIGIVTARDKFTLDLDRDRLYERICRFAELPVEEAREEFQLGKDTRDWKVALAQEDLRQGGLDRKNLYPLHYRPFDIRYTCYTGTSRGFHCMPRGRVMRHMLTGDNLGLVTVRQVAERDFNHATVANGIIDARMTLSNKGNAYLFPLYRHDEEVNGLVKRENLAPGFRRWLDERYGEQHAPERVLGCIHAILHSPDYRSRYATFLREDFPRIPFPRDNDEFLRLAGIGAELTAAQLLQKDITEGAELYGDGAGHLVERLRHDEKRERLYFNRDEYFAPLPPEVWNFHICGYRPLHKFLSSRKGRKLSSDEIQTIKKAARAIAFTISAQQELDGG